MFFERVTDETELKTLLGRLRLGCMLLAPAALIEGVFAQVPVISNLYFAGIIYCDRAPWRERLGAIRDGFLDASDNLMQWVDRERGKSRTSVGI